MEKVIATGTIEDVLESRIEKPSHYHPDLINVVDPSVWAKAFMEELRNPSTLLDEDWLLGWFTDTITAGYLFAKREPLSVCKAALIAGETKGPLSEW